MTTSARKITNTGTSKNIGRFFSAKMQVGVWYESLLERDYMYLLEIDPQVLSYSSQPLKITYTLDNKKRQYTPDFLVERHDSRQIVEIKPASQLKSASNSQKLPIIAQIFQQEGWEFVIITDAMIRREPLLSNIKLLYRYALIPLPLPILINCHKYFRNQPTLTLQEAENDLKPHGIGRGTLLKLIFTGLLATNLMTPINKLSPISLCPSQWERSITE